MKIRRALPSDAVPMHRVATTLQLEGRDLQLAQETGFFLFVGTPEHYRNTLTASPYCWVAMDDENCIGFLTTMTASGVAKFPKPKSRELFSKDGKFPLVLEQIGVLPDWQRRGVGQALLDTLLQECPEPRIVSTIIHQPVRNTRSIQFLVEKNGWKPWREVRTEKRVWGFYEWEK